LVSRWKGKSDFQRKKAADEMSTSAGFFTKK